MKKDVLSFRALNLLSILFAAVVSSEQIPPANTTVRPSPNRNLRDCDCFTVSGPDPGYFQHYKLWDFRNVPLRDSPPSNSTNPNRDTEETWSDWFIESLEGVEDNEDDENDLEERNQAPESDALWFFKTAFDKDWVSQQWQRPRNPDAPIDMINSKKNVFFTRNRDEYNPHATHLVLRTTRFDNFASTAEIETRIHNIYHCSLRVRLRVLPSDIVISQPKQTEKPPPPDPRHNPLPSPNKQTSLNGTSSFEVGKPPPGACVGIFTYQARNCESDIEILTSDPPHRVRYANQPDYDPTLDKMIPGASSIIDLPIPWTTWSTHRLDWFPSVSRWWVDDKPQVANGYQVPNVQSRVVINLWSDGGVWTGDMRVGESIFLGIEYIELAYNRSSDGAKYITPSSRRHGGHQNVSVVGVGEGDEVEKALWEPDTETATGTVKGRGKCKKGKKGRKCRKKHGKGKKGDKDRGESLCRRPCNIDDFRLHDISGQH